MADYSTSIEIEAPPEIVFAHLTTAEGMVAWMGQYADLNPTPGGAFVVDINGAPVRGEYLVVEPPHRVVVSWGMAGSEVLPPGASRVEFTLTATPGGTRLDLVHSGLPTDVQADRHATGWGHFLARLAVTAGGADPGPDPWAVPAAEGAEG
jgi:uncharacterized protein YndB with AHSA1/START domain